MMVNISNKNCFKYYNIAQMNGTVTLTLSIWNTEDINNPWIAP
jgi:hypothetical protein